MPAGRSVRPGPCLPFFFREKFLAGKVIDVPIRAIPIDAAFGNFFFFSSSSSGLRSLVTCFHDPFNWFESFSYRKAGSVLYNPTFCLRSIPSLSLSGHIWLGEILPFFSGAPFQNYRRSKTPHTSRPLFTGSSEWPTQSRILLRQLVRLMSIPTVEPLGPWKGRVRTDTIHSTEAAAPEKTNTEVNGTVDTPAAEDGAEQAPEGTI